MKKTYHRWQDVRKKKLTPQQLEAIDQAVEQDLLALDLQAIRELIGKTQTEVAAATAMTQSEVSRLERRPDVRLSTLKRFVEALGGEVGEAHVHTDVEVRGVGHVAVGVEMRPRDLESLLERHQLQLVGGLAKT